MLEQSGSQHQQQLDEMTIARSKCLEELDNFHIQLIEKDKEVNFLKVC